MLLLLLSPVFKFAKGTILSLVSAGYRMSAITAVFYSRSRSHSVKLNGIRACYNRKGSSYIMELLGSCLRRDKREKERGIGEEGPLFLFAFFFLSPFRGFLRLPYRLLSLRNTASLYTTLRLLSPKTSTWISPTVSSQRHRENCRCLQLTTMH